MDDGIRGGEALSLDQLLHVLEVLLTAQLDVTSTLYLLVHSLLLLTVHGIRHKRLEHFYLGQSHLVLLLFH